MASINIDYFENWLFYGFISNNNWKLWKIDRKYFEIWCKIFFVLLLILFLLELKLYMLKRIVSHIYRNVCFCIGTQSFCIGTQSPCIGTPWFFSKISEIFLHKNPILLKYAFWLAQYDANWIFFCRVIPQDEQLYKVVNFHSHQNSLQLRKMRLQHTGWLYGNQTSLKRGRRQPSCQEQMV